MQSLLAGILGIFFLCVAWYAAQTGYSRSLAEQGSASRQLSLTEQAVKLSPSDPETHYHRAAVLWAAKDQAGAVREAERAVTLRPRDYFLWFRLGFYRYASGDKIGALAPFKEASRLAPYYAEPHYYIGSILLDQAEREEAFAELRRAAASDPDFLPDLISMAGETFGDDTKSIELAVQPRSQHARLALAQYFVQHNKTKEAMNLFRGSGRSSDQDQHRFLATLLSAKRFVEAFELWGLLNQGAAGIGRFTDGGFENESDLSDPGFGWHRPRGLEGLQISFDPTMYNSGRQSMRLEFEGQAKPGVAVLTQLVRVEPNTRYNLRFAVHMSEIVTGGVPFISVLDANSQNLLAEANLTVQNNSPGKWQDYSVDFANTETTNTIIISLKRRNCRALPCPIFGRLWLDDFALGRMD
jgi:tetratricopeptide (TPR) repeat protein